MRIHAQLYVVLLIQYSIFPSVLLLHVNVMPAHGIFGFFVNFCRYPRIPDKYLIKRIMGLKTDIAQ